jgi:hypothetical protein
MNRKDVGQSGEFSVPSFIRRNFEAVKTHGKLISLWYMKEFFAEELMDILAHLEALEEISRTAPDADAWDPDLVEINVQQLSLAHEWCEKWGLRMSAQFSAKVINLHLLPPDEREKQIRFTKDIFREEIGVYRMSVLGEQVKHLQGLIREELELEMFLYVTPNELERYRRTDPFGKKIGDKWPDIRTDIQEANKCLVLRRYSACVLHLMRATEYLVQRIAHAYGVQPKRDGVDIPIEEEVWGRLTPKIKTEIEKKEKSGTADAKDTEFKKIIATLDTIRALWRNEVAHPKRHFTRGEAIAIFDMSKGVAMGLLPLF